MFMVLKEDIQNVLFKCEKVLEVSEIKLTRLKKEHKMLCKVINDYELSDDNSIIYNEICARCINVSEEIDNVKNDIKNTKKVITKIKPLLSSMEIIEENEAVTDNIEIGQLD